MKPSDFIFNSDYLTIAQTGSVKPTTVVFPSRQFPTENQQMKPFYTELEIYAPASAGAVDRIYIDYNGIRHITSQIYQPPDFDYRGGNYYQGQYWVLNVYRKDANTLVARCDFSPPFSAGTIPSTPTLTFSISASNFKPPNVF